MRWYECPLWYKHMYRDICVNAYVCPKRTSIYIILYKYTYIYIYQLASLPYVSISMMFPGKKPHSKSKNVASTPKNKAKGSSRRPERWWTMRLCLACFRWVGEASSLSHVGTVDQWLHYLVGCWKNMCLLVILPTSDVFICYPPNLWWSHYDVERLNQWNSNISPCHISI